MYVNIQDASFVQIAKCLNLLLSNWKAYDLGQI